LTTLLVIKGYAVIYAFLFIISIKLHPGSTNGSLFNGTELKSNDQLEIEVGLEITV